MHRLQRQFVYSNLQLFSLTAQANTIDESTGEFVVMWQLQGGGNEETLLQSEQRGNQMLMLLY